MITTLFIERCGGSENAQALIDELAHHGFEASFSVKAVKVFAKDGLSWDEVDKVIALATAFGGTLSPPKPTPPSDIDSFADKLICVPRE